MTIGRIGDNGGAQAMLDIEAVIAKARAMCEAQEEANRDLRHINDALNQAQTAERVSLMKDAATDKLVGGLVGAGASALSLGVEAFAPSDGEGAWPRIAQQGIEATRDAGTAYFAMQATNHEADAVQAQSIASHFETVAEDRRADVGAAAKASERLQDAFAALQRARTEAQLAASRG